MEYEPVHNFPFGIGPNTILFDSEKKENDYININQIIE